MGKQKLLADLTTAIPPDEQRCCKHNGIKGWRCRNLLSADNHLKYCAKHYNDMVVYNSSKKRKVKVETTEKKIELKRCDGVELRSSRKTSECLVELEESMEFYKNKCLELSVELEKKKLECIEIQAKLANLESKKIAGEDEFKEYIRAREVITDTRIRRLEERAESTQERITHLEGKIEKMTRKAKDENQIDTSKTSTLHAETSGRRNGPLVTEMGTYHSEAEDEIPKISVVNISSESLNALRGGESFVEDSDSSTTDSDFSLGEAMDKFVMTYYKKKSDEDENK